MAGEERRRYPRIPVEIFIEYEALEQFFKDYVTNISRGGIFIQTETPLPIGTKLYIRFLLPGSQEVIKTEGEVVWRSEEGKQRGMGVAFKKLDREARDRVEAIVLQAWGDERGEED